MGGEQQFSTEMMKDEVATCSLRPWAVLIQEGSRVDAQAFGAGLGLPEGFHIGKIRKDPPAELTKSSHFGDAQARECFMCGMYLHACLRV